MTRHDETTAECLVFTEKDGVLSPLGHDLVLRVARFEIELDEEGGRVEARMDARSLRYVAALTNGARDPEALGARDRALVEENVRETIGASRHAEIAFASSSIAREGDRARLAGRLTLRGTTREIAVVAHRDGARWTAEASVHQPDFGIRPYSAMLGALRVRPVVRVQVTVPAT